MREMRLAWNLQSFRNKDGLATFAGDWMPDTLANRQTLNALLEQALKAHGRGTHWVEIRGCAGKLQ